MEKDTLNKTRMNLKSKSKTSKIYSQKVFFEPKSYSKVLS